MTLIEYAAALEKSRKPGDAAVARYIRAHQVRLSYWLGRYSQRMNREDREEMLQIALLACVEATRSPDAETALKNVRNAIERHAYDAYAWHNRRAPQSTDTLTNEEN